MRQISVVFVVAASLLGGACSGLAPSGQETVADLESVTSATASPADTIGSVLPFTDTKLDIANQLAETIPMDAECFVGLLDSVSVEDLAGVGIGLDGVADDLAQRLIFSMGSPVFEAVVLSYSTCSEAFDKAVTEDYSDLMDDSQLTCYLESARPNVRIVMIHMFGTTKGSKSSLEATPEPYKSEFEAGLAEHNELVLACR